MVAVNESSYSPSYPIFGVFISFHHLFSLSPARGEEEEVGRVILVSEFITDWRDE